MIFKFLTIAFIFLSFGACTSIGEGNNINQFDKVYNIWKKESTQENIRIMSKPTAYKQLSSYKSFLNLNNKYLVNIISKIEKDDGVDFILADVIIAKMNWNNEEFDLYHGGIRARQVVLKFKNQNENKLKN